MDVETLFNSSELQRIQAIRNDLVRFHLERYGSITPDAYETAMANAIETFENER